MRKLPKPKVPGAEVFKLCAASVQDVELKNGLHQAEVIIPAKEVLYEKLTKSAKLHQMEPMDDVAGTLSTAQMQRLYNQTFVKSKKTRLVYANLKKACTNDICPLCGQGTVRQLDHYLAISKFPVFGLSPINLVPACSDCNKNKLDHIPSSASELTIHPYFDNVEDDQWLHAKVVDGIPGAVTFHVQPPQTWNVVKRERMKTHFRIFGLGLLYATHAAVEIGNIRHQLQRLAGTPGSDELVRGYLRECAASRAAAHINSWQTAVYTALAESDWFCSGGFNEED